MSEELKDKDSIQDQLNSYHIENCELNEELIRNKLEFEKQIKIVNSNLNNEINEKTKLIDNIKVLENDLIKIKEDYKKQIEIVTKSIKKELNNENNEKTKLTDNNKILEDDLFKIKEELKDKNIIQHKLNNFQKQNSDL